MLRISSGAWPILALALSVSGLASAPAYEFLTTAGLSRAISGRWQMVGQGDFFIEFGPIDESAGLGALSVLPSTPAGATCATARSECGQYTVLNDSTLSLVMGSSRSVLVVTESGGDLLRFRVGEDPHSTVISARRVR